MSNNAFVNDLPSFNTQDFNQGVEPAANAAPVTGADDQGSKINYDLISEIPVEVHVVVGTCSMPVHELMNLGRGSVIPLNKRIGEPVDLCIKNRVIARGEIVHVDQEGGQGHYGVSLTEVVRSGRRSHQLT